jgi:hypothetical protein
MAPSKEIEPPQPLPAGTYHCEVDSPPSQEETSHPYRVYKFKILKAIKLVKED